MANFNKSFNFRNGVQVDNDNFIVNSNGLVGIGTTIPRDFLLDVYGDSRIVGVISASSIESPSVSIEYLSADNVNISGVITATTFVGSASGLSDIYAVAVDGWYISAGTISTTFKVGIGTTLPTGDFQVGTAVTINSTGNASYSGVLTALSFSGSGLNISQLDASNISTGTLSNSRLPSGISISGIATAYSFSGFGTDITGIDASNISTGTLSNSRLPSNINVSGVITSPQADITTGSIIDATVTRIDAGIGTFDSLRVDNTTDTTLTIRGDQTSILSIGASVGAGNSSVELKYDSSTGDFNVSNYDIGDISLNLHEGTGAGSTGGFKVKYDNSNIINATYDGRVSINKNTPDSGYNLDVNGNVKVSNDGIVLGILTVGSGINEITIGDGSYFPVDPNQNFNVNSGVSTFNNLEIIDSIKPTEIGTPLGIGLTPGGGDTVGVGSDLVIVSADVQVGSGYSVFVQDLSVSNYINIQTTTGVGGSISADIFNIANKTNLGVTTVFGTFDVNNNSQSDISVSSLKILINSDRAAFVGIGTTTNDNNPLYDVIINGNTFVTGDLSCSERFGIIPDGEFRSDPRGSTSFFTPTFDYGELQVDTGNASLIIDGNLCIVPSVGISTVGFGSTNGGIIFDPNIIDDGRLTYVGVNTFFPRSIFDVGTASTTTNSYFLPPSLTQSELNIVSNLWTNPTGFGTLTARRVTPDGVPGGALVYNKTNTRLEVGIGSTTFCGIATLTNNHTGFEAFVPPKLTTAQRNTMTAAGISSGGIIYNTSLSKLQFYNGSTWETVTSS